MSRRTRLSVLLAALLALWLLIFGAVWDQAHLWAALAAGVTWAEAPQFAEVVER